MEGEGLGGGMGVGREEIEALRAEVARLRADTATAQAETAALRAREARRDLEGALAGKRFMHGAETLQLSPRCRGSLVEALLELEVAARETVLSAIGGVELAPVGVVAFGGGEDAGNGSAAPGIELTAADRMLIEEEARRKGVAVAEVERQFREVRAARAARG